MKPATERLENRTGGLALFLYLFLLLFGYQSDCPYSFIHPHCVIQSPHGFIRSLCSFFNLSLHSIHSLILSTHLSIYLFFHPSKFIHPFHPSIFFYSPTQPFFLSTHPSIINTTYSAFNGRPSIYNFISLNIH